MMRHCKMCRADAIGLLGNDRSAEFAHITCSPTCGPPSEEGPIGIIMEGKTSYRVAVASSDGKEVDLGFGQTNMFFTYEVEGERITRTGTIGIDVDLDAPLFGKEHSEKLEKAARKLSGKDLVIATGFGHKAIDLLQRQNVSPIVEKGEVTAAIRKAIDDLFAERQRTFE